MAIEKEITTANGISVSYHRISSIRFDDGNVEAEVISYSSEKYRNIEKDKRAKERRQLEIGEIVAEKCKIPPEERTKEEEEEIQNLLKEGEEIGTITYDVSMSVYSGVYKIDLADDRKKSDDISIGDIYNKLKEMEPFKDAKDDLPEKESK